MKEEFLPLKRRKKLHPWNEGSECTLRVKEVPRSVQLVPRSNQHGDTPVIGYSDHTAVAPRGGGGVDGPSFGLC
jgi:hypothetical protein